MHNYQELKIWQKAISLSVKIYPLTESFPDTEKYNLCIQIKKCSVSIPSNIAEGAGRNSDKDFMRFLGIALGSTFELQTQLILSSKLGYLSGKDFDIVNQEIEELKKMIWGFKKSLHLEGVGLSS